jgi:serine/threonine protein kinase
VYFSVGCTTQEAEEWISNPIDALKADVYSYGITCAELLTGEYPYPLPEFQRTDLLSTILQGGRPHLPHEYCPIPVKDLIIRCWDTHACNRPTFLQVCEELMNFKTLIFNHQTEKKKNHSYTHT